jgi:Ca-activated chloride channel family protein
MRYLMALVCLLAACGTPRPQADAAPPVSPESTAPSDDILRAGLESPYVLTSGDGLAWLSVLITPPPTTGPREPLSLALVVDTSGSMEGDKIEHARAATRSMIEALLPGDQVAIVQFSDAARVVSPLATIGQTHLPALLDLVAKLPADGSTALHAGVVQGLTELDRGTGLRRLLLISDGLANVGPAKPEEILAALPPTRATLSALGVGTEYDETVLTALAGRGGGGFHHLTDPVQLAGILQAELDRARAVGGREAVITLVPRPGTEIVAAAPGLTLQRQADGSVKIPVGDLYGGVTRTVTVQVRVPRVGTGGPVAAVQLAYTTQAKDTLTREVLVDYRLTSSADEVTQSQVPAYMVAADRTRVAHVLSDAAALIKEGDLLEAQALLRDERSRLEARQTRLTGAEQTEVGALIQLFHDPYVDTDLESSGSAPTAPDVLPALVEALRQGQMVDEARLPGLAKDQLRILRNVAYARHGYRFKDADLQAFFAKTPWYRADAGFQPNRLTPTDVRNVATLKGWEQQASLVAASARRPAAPAVTSGDFNTLIDRVRRGEVLPPTLLDGLSLTQLRLLRNTAYARHGYVFRAGDLRTFFGATPWYRLDPTFGPSDLGPEDSTNVRQIKEREQGRVFSGGREALREFELRNRARAHQVVH